VAGEGLTAGRGRRAADVRLAAPAAGLGGRAVAAVEQAAAAVADLTTVMTAAGGGAGERLTAGRTSADIGDDGTTHEPARAVAAVQNAPAAVADAATVVTATDVAGDGDAGRAVGGAALRPGHEGVRGRGVRGTVGTRSVGEDRPVGTGPAAHERMLLAAPRGQPRGNNEISQ
jgi:hypothetical protein